MEQNGMYDEDDTDVDMDDDGRAKQGKESKKKRLGLDDDEPPLEGYQRSVMLPFIRVLYEVSMYVR